MMPKIVARLLYQWGQIFCNDQSRSWIAFYFIARTNLEW